MAQKPTTPKKFRQARKSAKADAKKAFSGKPQARLKDKLAKLELVDKQALDEMKKESKGRFITDDRGNRIQTQPTETARERFDREGRAKREEFRASERERAGIKEPEAKKADTKKPATKKAAVKSKPKVKKAPLTTPGSKTPDMLKTSEGKARYEKLIKEGVKPKSALNKALFYEAKLPGQAADTPKAETKKSAKVKKVGGKVTDAKLTKLEDDYIKKTQDRLTKEGKLSASREVAIRPKGEVVSKRTGTVVSQNVKATPIPGSDTVVKKKGSKLTKFVKGGLLAGLVMEIAQLGQTKKDTERLLQLEADIARLKGKMPDSKWKNAVDSLPQSGRNILNSVSFGIIKGRTGERADKLQTEYNKLEAARAKKQAATNKGLRYGPMGESLVPGTPDYARGSKIAPKFKDGKVIPGAMPGAKPGASGAAGGSSGGGAGSSGSAGGGSGSSGGGSKGGTTPKVTAGSAYIVKSGDTLSAIAKAAGVSLADIYATNKKFKQNPKYKGGNMIWSGTKVNIPTKK